MLKQIVVNTLNRSGRKTRSFSIVVLAQDFKEESPENLGAMLQIADTHHQDSLARWSLHNAAQILAKRLTITTGAPWSPENVVKID